MIGFLTTLDLLLWISFGVCAIGFIATIHLRPYKGDFVLKAIPALSLAAMAFLYVPDAHGKLLFAALVLSAAGDVSLAFKGERNFVTGLVFFLLAHLLYVVMFSLDGDFGLERWWMILLLVALAIGMGIVLYPRLGEMKIPVMMYLSVILSMGILACLSQGRNPWMLIAGATLFMLSDSVIALDRFLRPIPGAQIIIMTTYYSGQLLICRSFIPNSLP